MKIIDTGLPKPKKKSSRPMKERIDHVAHYGEDGLNLFALSSHHRAEKAINFALKMRSKGYHVFVVGEDDSGRLTATMDYLNQYIKSLPIPNDWVYVNNFEQTHRPIPFSLPSGMGSLLQKKTSEFVTSIGTVLNKTLNSSQYLSQVNKLSQNLQTQIDQQINDIQALAHSKGLEIIENSEGFTIKNNIGEKNNHISKDIQAIRKQLNYLSLSVQLTAQKINQQIEELKRHTSHKVILPLFKKYKNEFEKYLLTWIDSFEKDVLDNVDLFLDTENSQTYSLIKERYSINLLVNHKGVQNPKVILESHPSYENLFGSIKYRAVSNGGFETNFSLIRGGALHYANGGILVLRADTIAKDLDVWEALKAALRDKKITIEERYRENGMPLVDAPNPKSIPLDIQVFLISSPFWYYNLFINDPDFHSHFKIKADIDPDLPISLENITIYKNLIKASVAKINGMKIDNEAIEFLINYSSRIAGSKDKLSARFELITDILTEAAMWCQDSTINKLSVQEILQKRHYRNARLEDLSHQEINAGYIRIKTEGKVIGQINGLSVLSYGEHNYGMPARITARTYVGEDGVVNIERLTEMGGPIQQKGTFVLEGFLKGVFAQNFPLSCSCSLTFEQNYGEVEGDSASLAELAVILSSLADAPLRQDIAVTGSIDQFGFTQAVGGIYHKIEGFYRLCKYRGLTGRQGVIIPITNNINLTLCPELLEEIEQKRFFIWSVEHIFAAMELLTEELCGVKIGTSFTKGSLFKQIYDKLQHYRKAIIAKK